jgi:hypothetical protein
MREKLKTYLVEREFRRRGAKIVDGRRVSFDLNIGRRNPSGGLVGIGNKLLVCSRDIIQGRFYVRQ